MSIANTISNAGAAVGRGIEKRQENKNLRKQILTRLGTIPELEEKMNEFEGMSNADLQGLEQGMIMRQAQHLQEQKAKEAELRQQQIQQEMEQKKEAHLANIALKENEVIAARNKNSAFADVQNRDLAAEQREQEAHEAKMGEYMRKADAPKAGTVTEIQPGVKMVNLGNGQHQLLRDKPAEGFEKMQMPDGSTAYKANFKLDDLISPMGKKLFEQSGGSDPMAILAAMLGGGQPGQPAAAPAAAEPAVKTVTTQAEYDSLPSGATYIEDGKKYRKP